ncbi:DgyrCDS13382 [Dimorphilus gyrociliatus]|uniref:DgyrCDS13382 n=1 Tax=Dimorphilus gyrociliatus TaxID=2664684 RepID=A0A7I8WAI5_9ANNE|nr:DgyrCDS13382 [Dimorphilus gyrociliatus]
MVFMDCCSYLFDLRTLTWGFGVLVTYYLFKKRSGKEDKSGKVCWRMSKGLVACVAYQGQRQTMEDRMNIIRSGKVGDIYSVFDGHGGEFAVEFVEKMLISRLLTRLYKPFSNGLKGRYLQSMIRQEIAYVANLLNKIEDESGEKSGTTVCVTLKKNDKIYIANVGDSRALVCTNDNKIIQITRDHKPNDKLERKRIEKSGSYVKFVQTICRLEGILSVSRTLGDRQVGGVSNEPDIFVRNTQDCKFLLMATDGFWDAFTNEEAVETILQRRKQFSLKNTCEFLTKMAEVYGSMDNITVLIAEF